MSRDLDAFDARCDREAATLEQLRAYRASRPGPAYAWLDRAIRDAERAACNPWTDRSPRP